MADPDKNIVLTPAEKQILNHPATFKVFLFVLVPFLAGFNIYVMATGRWWAGLVLSIQLACFTALLGVMRSRLPDIKKVLTYRYLLRFQILVFGLYLLLIIGVFHQVEVTPWAFLYVFLVSLWLPGRQGVTNALGFILGLFFLVLWWDSSFFSANKAYLVRFFFALSVFSLLALSSAMLRRQYLAHLQKVRDRLEASEARHREMARTLKEQIDERDRMEKRLHHAIKMETVGRVAAGVAHDLNNILSGIVTYPELLLLDLKEDDPMYQPLETVRVSGLKAAAIVDDLLTLSRRGVAVAQPVDMGQVMEAYLKSPEFGHLKKAHPEVRVNCRQDPGMAQIIGSPVHLSKTLMNLVSNAVEAISGSGEVFICVKPKRLAKAHPLAVQVQGVAEIPGGDYVVVSVSDTGTGIAPQDMESVFEPFYTRKQMGMSGTGLGMSLVLETVNDHNGFIRMRSTPGEGTKIDLFFPPSPGDAKVDENASDLGSLMGGKAAVLVVDDEPSQRLIAGRILTRLGYLVHCCASGEEALAYLEDHEADLVILDIHMEPGMSGVETCEKMLVRAPLQKVLFATGYADAKTMARAQKLGQGAFLFKPYSLEGMGTMIRDRLESDVQERNI